ncbi:MAG: hypothetical protein HGA95_05230, partial [Caldiserica bacterium]|nr:hypothetical protein [Caldisericota bacterium]
MIDKRKKKELLLKLNWSSGRDPNEERPFAESAKGLTAEIVWSFVFMGILFL